MPEPQTCVARVPLFQGLTGEEQGQVARLARPMDVARGSVVSMAGERTQRLLVVHSGSLKISRVLADGREQILRTAHVGDVVGERGFLTGQPSHDLVTALADCRLCTFDHQDLAALVARYPDVGMRMLRTLSDRLTQAESLLTAVTSSDVTARVAAYLASLAAGAGGASNKITLPMSKRETAAHLGTTAETLSRRLAAMAAQGIVALEGQRDVVVLDPGALHEMARTASADGALFEE